MKVVSNTGPLVALGKLGRLDLLERGILSQRDTKGLFQKMQRRRDIWVSQKIIQAAIESLKK